MSENLDLKVTTIQKQIATQFGLRKNRMARRLITWN